MTRMLGTLLLLLAVGVGAASACPPVSFARSYSYGHAAVYHAPAVATYAYPSYFVAYGGAGADAVLSEVKLLKAQLQIESLKVQLLLTQQGGGNGPSPLSGPRPEQSPRPAEDAVRAVQQSCAECHSGATAKGKLALFSGSGAAKLSPDQMGACIQHVLDGTMPPPAKGKLSDGQKVAVLSGLTKWPSQ